MDYFITYGEYQKHLKDYYYRTGHRMQFREMMSYLMRKHLLYEAPLSGVHPRQMMDEMSEQEINRFMDSLVFTVNISAEPTHVFEADIIPNFRDAFIIRHPRYTRQLLHEHNYFEINYVYAGTCTFAFEDTSRTMREGEINIIAPGSRHDIIIDDESTVFCMMLRKSTVNKTFFSLLSRKDLLAQFFQTSLSGEAKTNYLMFFCEPDKWLHRILFNAMAECYKTDTYSNTCCISWLNQFFAYLLRHYSNTLQFYDYPLGSEFILISQYIQHNYQTLTLSSLAKFFHYSEPYLCTLIRKNTGQSFTELVKDLRLSEATEYLLNTDMKINEIAERVGYNSSDHFSRVFRAQYHMSPQKYRKENGHREESLVPFMGN